MSLSNDTKISNDIIKSQENEIAINEIVSNKPRYTDLEQEQQDNLLNKTKENTLINSLIKFELSYPIMKQMKTDIYFTENIPINPDERFDYLIDLNHLDGFQALKTKWLFFKINKIDFFWKTYDGKEVVIMKYLPPCSSYVKSSIQLSLAANNGKETLINPHYVIRNAFHGRIDINNELYKEIIERNTVISSGLQDNIFVSNFNYDITYLDYGMFTFNSLTDERILIQMKYNISFFTYGDPESQFEPDPHVPADPFNPNNPL